MNGGTRMQQSDWEWYSTVLVEANKRLQTHLDEALLRLRRTSDELELQREHNETLFQLLAQRDRQIAFMDAGAWRSAQAVVALREELRQLRAVVTVDSQGGQG